VLWLGMVLLCSYCILAAADRDVGGEGCSAVAADVTVALLQSRKKSTRAHKVTALSHHRVCSKDGML
jgi:hypothetical protein